MTYADLEAVAESIEMYQDLLVPGFLQTADYARAVLRAIVSETIYDNIVKHAFPQIDPGTWYPVVAVIKEGPKSAWVHVPGDYQAPSRAGVVHQRQSA